MAKEKNEIIKKAEKELEYLTGDEEVKRMAFLREKWERDNLSLMAQAKEEGKLEIAKKMKAKGTPIEDIIEITELTKEELEKL